MTATSSPRYAMVFIFTTVLLDMVGFGIIIPVIPSLIAQVGEISLARASVIGGWMYFAFSATQFLFGPALGNLSDAIGRRPLLLIAVAGLGFDYLLHALAPNLTWLFVGRIFAGLCGASYVIANAYIADVTPPEERAKAFGLMGAAFGLGFVIGPAIGGLLGQFGPRVPFYVAAAVSGANLLFGYFVLPETLKPENRRAFEWSRANPMATFRIFKSYRGAVPLCSVLFAYFFATSVYPAIWPYWGMARFNWSSAIIGLTLAAFGTTMAVTQGVLTGVAVKFFGERKLALLGLVAATLGSIGFAMAPNLTSVLLLLIVHAPEGFVQPMLSAIISKEVPEDAQGELQGGLASLMSVAMLAGTVFFTQVFGYFVSNGAEFVSTGIAYMIAAALLLFVVLGYLNYLRLHFEVFEEK
jgi:DHA1 family tetracycline resistance protein-like MFS transporter